MATDHGVRGSNPLQCEFLILSMMIKTVVSGPFETNAYVVGCPTTKEAAIIDPAPESTKTIVEIIENEKLTPVAILLTHSHWDHIADVFKVKKHFDVPVYVHERDAENLRRPGADGMPLFGPTEAVEADLFLKGGESISIGDLTFDVIHTPGHTPGGVCFHEKDEGILISGDTLFQGTIGNLSFPTSNSDDMWQSLELLSHLPPETKVYPGHGPATTIQNEPWLSDAKRFFGGQ